MGTMSPPLRCHPPRKRGIHAMPRMGIGSNTALDLRLRGDDEALHTPHRIAGALRLPRGGGVFSSSGFYVRGRRYAPSPGGRGLGARGYGLKRCLSSKKYLAIACINQ
jgi:hypothetical protein